MSTDLADFAGAERGRDAWMRVLPWTFVVAPLIVPNTVLITAFFRDSRADTGRTWRGIWRDRPVDGRFVEHHWPEHPMC